MDLEELPISDNLYQEIVNWTNWYEQSEFWRDPSERKNSFDTKAFNACGANLAAKLRKELPDWQVVYRPES